MTDPAPPDLLTVLDALPTPVFWIDPQMRHAYANAAGAAVHGRPRAEVVGRTLADLGAPADAAARVEAVFRRVFETGRPVVERVPFPRADGAEAVFAVRVAPLHGPDGRVDGVVGVAADVTRELAAEAALQEAEARFQAFMDAGPAVGWMKDEAGRYVYLSGSCLRLFRVGPADWLGKTDADIWPAEVARTFAANDRRVLATGRPEQVTESSPDPDGVVRTWLNVKFPYTDAAGRRFAGGVGIDITDWVAAEDARRKAEAEAKAAADREKEAARMVEAQKLESLGVLAGGIAHDFNNILTAILGFTSLARMELAGGEPGNAADHLGKVETAAQRAADLCAQMLAYAGRGQFAIRPAVLNHLIEEMAQLLGSSVSKKAVLRFDLSPGLPPVRGDLTQLRQVVMNLITNASDAIGDTSGVVTLATGLIDADEGYLRDVGADHLPARRYAYLEVSDTGCGMPDDVKARIFEPFYTTKFTGRGLGLSAVQGIVRAHGGAVKVYSQPGKGTTFKILLPTVDEPVAPEPAGAGGRPAFGRGRRVLVVDDEEDVRVLAREVLTRFGFAVELAPDGRAGVAAFAADPAAVALVLVDLTMPYLGGADVFREVRRLRKDAPVVLTSGFAAGDATAGFEGKGLAGFLRKPFRAEDLVETVYAAVGP